MVRGAGGIIDVDFALRMHLTGVGQLHFVHNEAVGNLDGVATAGSMADELCDLMLLPVVGDDEVEVCDVGAGVGLEAESDAGSSGRHLDEKLRSVM